MDGKKGMKEEGKKERMEGRDRGRRGGEMEKRRGWKKGQSGKDGMEG